MAARWVAMLRAINVGTTNRVTAARLAELITAAGVTDVSAYLQSGNVFFAAAGDREAIATAIESQLAGAGMKGVKAMVRTADELAALVALDPFAGLDPEAHRCSVAFFRHPPAVMPEERLATAGMELRHVDELHLCLATARDAKVSGGAASALFDKAWKVSSTTRWWNVVQEIAARAGAAEG
jgi:uncharacterized protein (DUF1697 family)